ncbi:leucine-rich repeat-containing protein 58 isoform X1 [Neocloeon triangulifer]|uniref:leucine-rich repeat-containing protein 58 isoform X1 n=1 Tax=Neocloeon triangulifer TaxID=2078957 RepID=UPI00286F5F5B|nr:leucine-rich repeat-containing protein 58 isoform X1 [Neocloeon triangulifer]XP_059482754.1 leucine-rich repeat-containing protein 58 isoform X1 [Neocloeon triangulifer]
MEWSSSGSDDSGSEGVLDASQMGDAEAVAGALERLVLAANGDNESAKTVGRFRRLHSLNLSCNTLTELPGALRHCARLEKLSLRSNRLAELPKWLTSLQNLRQLNLSGNSLAQFPMAVLELKNLKYLYMGSNGLESLPSAIEKLESLQILYLGGNRLTEVPSSLGNMLTLTALVLCDNQLRALPPSIAQLENLRSLLLHKNQLRTLPQEIVGLRGLRELSLRDNPLVVRFVRDMAQQVPSLLELAARVVSTHHLSYSTLPVTLKKYLDTAHHCVNPLCQGEKSNLNRAFLFLSSCMYLAGVFFDSRVEHVKFVDFCGKYRVPLLHYLCSQRCADGPDADLPPEAGQRLLRKVLLG